MNRTKLEMASVAAVLQGGLFACVHTALTALALSSFWSDFEDDTPFFPRLLLFDFLLAFLMGMALSDHLYARTKTVVIQGSFETLEMQASTGTFIAVAAFLSMSTMVIALSRETTLFVMPLIACIYVFVSAASRKEIHEHSIFSAPIVGAIVLFVSLLMTSEWSLLDDISVMFTRAIWSKESQNSQLDRSYLRHPGGAFDQSSFSSGLLSIAGMTSVLMVV